jgi:hypothetical protein
MTRPPDDIWFARLPGRGKMVPINARGYWVAAIFAAGMFASGLAGWVLSWTAPPAVWVTVMAAGMAASGIMFVLTAYRHTDHDKTIDDYREDRRS